MKHRSTRVTCTWSSRDQTFHVMFNTALNQALLRQGKKSVFMSPSVGHFKSLNAAQASVGLLSSVQFPSKDNLTLQAELIYLVLSLSVTQDTLWVQQEDDECGMETAQYQKNGRKTRERGEKRAHLVRYKQNTGGGQRTDWGCRFKDGSGLISELEDRPWDNQVKQQNCDGSHGVTAVTVRTCNSCFLSINCINTAILSDILSTCQVTHCSISFICRIFVVSRDCSCISSAFQLN